MTASTPAAATPATNLLVNGGDRCSACGAGLAIDQRYCVECGTRRGKPRFVIASAAVQEAATNASVRTGGGWSRLAATLAVIAVLLAIAVGVLIGSATRGQIRQPVKVVLTGSAGSGDSGGSAGSGGSTGSAGSGGSTGSKNGKQTGNFFGGG